MSDTPNDMSIEQLTQAIYGLREELASVRHELDEINKRMPDWLQNGNMYPPSLLRTLGIPTAYDSFGNILTYPTNHVINSDNKTKENK